MISVQRVDAQRRQTTQVPSPTNREHRESDLSRRSESFENTQKDVPMFGGPQIRPRSTTVQLSPTKDGIIIVEGSDEETKEEQAAREMFEIHDSTPASNRTIQNNTNNNTQSSKTSPDDDQQQ